MMTTPNPECRLTISQLNQVGRESPLIDLLRTHQVTRR